MRKWFVILALLFLAVPAVALYEGNNVTVHTLNLTAAPLPTRCQWCEDDYETFENSTFNFTVMAPAFMHVYTEAFGPLVPAEFIWGILWFLIFGMFWLRQEDVTVPAMVYIIVAVVITPFIPIGWYWLVYGMLVAVIVGWIYTLFVRS